MKTSKIRKMVCSLLLLASVSLVPSVFAEDQAGDFQVGLDAYNRGDLPGALASFRKAADAGSAEAQVWLGYILDRSEENEEAVRMYRAAAEQGNVDGIAGLAEMYAKGEGVEEDQQQALMLFRKAGEAGHGQSIRVLIAAYANGGLGVTQDTTELAYWKAKESALDAENN
jgi:TPR repeat protein